MSLFVVVFLFSRSATGRLPPAAAFRATTSDAFPVAHTETVTNCSKQTTLTHTHRKGSAVGKQTSRDARKGQARFALSRLPDSPGNPGYASGVAWPPRKRNNSLSESYAPFRLNPQ